VALRLSFVNQDYATELLVYAAATPDTGMVMRELEQMSLRLAGDKELRIAYDDESSWPFVWYLRDYKNTSYFTAGTGLSGDPDVVLVGSGNESKLKPQLVGKYLSRGYRLIWWPNQDVYSNLTPASLWRDLRDPDRRSYWWDILWSREYPQSTTSWPYVQRFSMYVRKDVAAKLWDYGPEVAGGGIQLPEDEYETKRVQATATASWGSFGSADGQLNYPKDLALDAEGNVYVADSYNHRVQVFDGQGRFLRKWGSQGSGPGQFQEPWGIAVDAAGQVYVADTWNHRIQKFDADGQFVKQWGFFGDTAGALGEAVMLYGPRDVAVDASGGVLVSDTGNKRVLRFSPEGEFVRQWGGAGSLDGQLREPVGLAVDDAGYVYVADTWNQRVQKFDAQGGFVDQWPVLGWEGEGVTNKPYLAVAASGNVYVTAPDYGRVVKFDASGDVVALWGQFGSDLGSFNMPSGIAVDSDGSVLVLDSSNHRVLRFAGIP
jgi:DNA-binding beta-propeller fold protein YncE